MATERNTNESLSFWALVWFYIHSNCDRCCCYYLLNNKRHRTEQNKTKQWKTWEQPKDDRGKKRRLNHFRWGTNVIVMRYIFRSWSFVCKADIYELRPCHHCYGNYRWNYSILISESFLVFWTQNSTYRSYAVAYMHMRLKWINCAHK